MFGEFNIDMILDLYKEHGLLLAIFLPFLEAFLPFLPLSGFVMFNATVFGFTGGFILSWIGSTLGCWAVYWIIRSFHNHKWMKKLTSTKQYEKMQNKFEKYSGIWAAIFYFLPIFPNSIMTIVAAVNKMNFRTFALSSSLGIAALFFVMCYGATNLMSILTSPLKLGIVLLLAITYFIFSKKMKMA